MRSRYTAYVMRDEAYLLATWHETSRPREVSFDAKQQWLGLKVKKHLPASSTGKDSVVEFVARFRLNGKVGRLHEVSRFRQEQDRWFYVDGRIAGKRRR